ncbi:transposase IS66 family protein [Thioalkalivibrio nitratireducens DSM 14787]|uniref:Transposase IS66 family protein n=1 Tax=Thioalkalivibrio nitratireducens (strain DSM 14787 / UNIQEM 213 / ALEN2) TaxID=1255043 RepID=L0DU77_THIND|nr:transposase IS66 family protein [Thioalkalivibrio nitratireducens DSM 14787]
MGFSTRCHRASFRVFRVRRCSPCRGSAGTTAPQPIRDIDRGVGGPGVPAHRAVQVRRNSGKFGIFP